MNVQDRSLLDLFSLGGPVMWVLLGLSTIGLVLFVERALFLHRGQIRTTQFLEGIKNIVRKRRVVEALTVAEETPGPVAAMVKAGLLHYEETEDRIRAAMTEAALVEIPVLERRLGAIGVIAQVAPVLGLLGTILGMIQAYQEFEKGGAYATAGALSGGMWQALLTTAAGLAVGVAARLGHHFLAGRMRALVYDMEWVANDVLRFLVAERSGAGGETPPAAEAAPGAGPDQPSGKP
ncbi:MAG: MotA/TolQ/ExbB proton channel family protein [Opitutaceae bacterium]|nr:MotA/TolQ/ExbB proton channel family protein [Opitutaceae bacterium]